MGGNNSLADTHNNSADHDLHTSEVIQNTTEQDWEPEIESDISDLVTEIIDNPNIIRENQWSIRNINTNNWTHIIQYNVNGWWIVVDDWSFTDIYGATYVKSNTWKGKRILFWRRKTY